MKPLILLTGLFLANAASASPENFRSCQSSLVLHKFVNCLETSDECRVEREELGSLVVDLSVDGPQKASGSATFKAKDGAEISSALACALTDENGDVNDMVCTMTAPVNDRLGHISLSFNSAQAPYFVAVFSEFGNAPIGDFATDQDCQ